MQPLVEHREISSFPDQDKSKGPQEVSGGVIEWAQNIDEYLQFAMTYDGILLVRDLYLPPTGYSIGSRRQWHHPADLPFSHLHSGSYAGVNKTPTMEVMKALQVSELNEGGNYLTSTVGGDILVHFGSYLGLNWGSRSHFWKGLGYNDNGFYNVDSTRHMLGTYDFAVSSRHPEFQKDCLPEMKKGSRMVVLNHREANVNTGRFNEWQYIVFPNSKVEDVYGDSNKAPHFKQLFHTSSEEGYTNWYGESNPEYEPRRLDKYEALGQFENARWGDKYSHTASSLKRDLDPNASYFDFYPVKGVRVDPGLLTKAAYEMGLFVEGKESNNNVRLNITGVVILTYSNTK